jgi:hypothetical protein
MEEKLITCLGLWCIGTWEDVNERVEIPGDQVRAGVFNLRPATTYFLRIFAENEVGASEPSDVVTIITAEEGTYK